MGFNIEDGELKGYTGSDENVVIPDGVTLIGYAAFHGGSSLGNGNMTMKSCTMPDSVKRIRTYAFESCKNLERINISKSMEKIDDYCFGFCDNLKEVLIPSIDLWLSIKMDNNSNPLQNGADLVIDGERIENVVIPDGIEAIGPYAFHGGNMKTVACPESVTSIGRSAFLKCQNISSITLSSKLESIGDYAFAFSGISEVKIPNTVTSIGEYAFYHCCNPIKITFDSLIPYVGRDAFAECPEGSELIFPSGTFITKDALPAGLASGTIVVSEKEAAYIMVYQKAKAWKNVVAQKCDESSDTVFGHMLDIFADDKKAAKPVAEYLEKYAAKLSKDKAQQAVKMLKEKKYKDIDSLVKIPEVKDCLAGKQYTENPIEEKLKQYLETRDILPEILTVVKNGIPYNGDPRLSSREAVAFVISEYKKEWLKRKSTVEGETMSIDVLADGNSVEINKEADEIASGLDKGKLVELLDTLMGRREYRNYLLAWARYADNDSIKTKTMFYRSDIKGKAVDKYKAGNIREALVISDESAARDFFESIGLLDHYLENRE